MIEPEITEYGFKYYDQKPEEFTLCEDIKDFLTLIGRKKKWLKENITVSRGVKHLIHNPLTGVYWYRETHKYTNIKLLNLYVKDKNVYLIKQN